MRLLLHHKAAVDHKDKLGRTALDHTQNEFQSDGIKAVVRLLENAIKHTNHAHSKRKSTSSFEQNVEQLAKPEATLGQHAPHAGQMYDTGLPVVRRVRPLQMKMG